MPGSWGACPWLLLTGTYCPGCGGLRAVYDLVHLRLVDALSSNVLVVALVVVGAAAWAMWTAAALRGRPLVTARFWSGVARPRTGYVLAVVLVAFTVVRNLPLGAWLAP